MSKALKYSTNMKEAKAFWDAARLLKGMKTSTHMPKAFLRKSAFRKPYPTEPLSSFRVSVTPIFDCWKNKIGRFRIRSF
jgi:3-polyprenyl-4-hydroxybenzoate decarboxylase